MNRGVLRVKEAIRFRKLKNVREVGIDDATVTDHGNRLPRMADNYTIHGGHHGGLKRNWILRTGPLTAEHFLPHWIVGRPEFLDGNVRRRIAIPLGQVVVDLDAQPGDVRERLGSLSRSVHRRRPNGIDPSRGEEFADGDGLASAKLVEVRICRSFSDDDAFGQSMANKNEFHIAVEGIGIRRTPRSCPLSKPTLSTPRAPTGLEGRATARSIGGTLGVDIV